MAVRAQALSVHKGLRHDVDGLVARETEQLARNGGRGDLDKHDVVQADAVERVLERKTALNLMRLDHGLHDVLDRERRLAIRHVGARDPVGHGPDRTEVVGRVAPLGGEPAVVKVEPADLRANVERASTALS